MSLACKDRPWKVAEGSMGVCRWDRLGPSGGTSWDHHPAHDHALFDSSNTVANTRCSYTLQRPCSDHHKRTKYAASSIGGGFSSAAPASLNKARAVSSNARMRSGAT